MKDCKKCGTKKDWQGDDIDCPFKDGSTEFGNNWNCGIINEIRDLCDIAGTGEDYRLQYQFCDDMKYAMINTFYVDGEWSEESTLGMCLYVEWYKSRGKTDEMWILGAHDSPKKPTLDDLKTIVKYYKDNPPQK